MKLDVASLIPMTRCWPLLVLCSTSHCSSSKLPRGPRTNPLPFA
jgi:hypothetical protein